jgi:hypothetical protein
MRTKYEALGSEPVRTLGKFDRFLDGAREQYRVDQEFFVAMTSPSEATAEQHAVHLTRSGEIRRAFAAAATATVGP